VYDSDDPVADIAAHSIYSVCKEAKNNGVSVLLGGIGGDELFWGYPHENSAVALSVRKMQLYKNPIFSDIHKIINPHDNPVMFNEKLKFLSMLMSPKNQMIYSDINQEFISAERYIKTKYHQKFVHRLGDARSSFDYLNLPKDEYNSVSLSREIACRLINTWLISNCNVLNDRLSMATSVEFRSPFLDYKLVDFVMSSRKIMSSYDRDPKYWFKKAMKGILPETILRRPKRGFTPPVNRWRSMIISRYNKYLMDGFLVNEKIFKREAMRSVQMFWKFRNSCWAQYYQLILLEIWGRHFYYGEKISLDN
jgi:asparagine synthase (glutamine-hydrolysing)